MPGTLSVAPAPVSISGVRAYDGTTALAASIFSLSGVVKGQDLTFSGTGSMADQNVGLSKTVSLDTLALRNGNSGLSSNYTLVGGTDLVRVNAAALTITAGNINKTYDGTLAASGTGNVTSGGLFGTDTLSASGLSFVDKNVGNHNKTVTANGVSVLDGNNGANYNVTYVSNTSSTIDPRALKVVAQAADKVYDGTTTASVALTDNRVAGDVLTLSLKPSLTGSATSGTYISITDANGASTQIVSGSSGANFADKSAAVGKTVFVVGIQVLGTDAGNYNANTTALSTASVTPKALTVVATGQNKVYDGSSTDAVILSSSGVVRGDNLNLGVLDAANNFSHTGSFADSAAGTGKVVSVTNITARGGDAGNYSLNNTTSSTTANVTPKFITIVANGTDKVYDGSTFDTVNLSSSGVLQQDLGNVSLSGTGAFSNKNVGTGKAVAVSNISVGGSQAGNYQVNNSTATAYATVTAKNLLVTASGGNKTYDGSAANAVILTSNDVVSGDTVKFASSSAVFADKNVGAAKTITISGISLTGTDAKNYTNNTSASSTANITAKGLTVLAVGQNKVYDGNTTDLVSLSSSGVVKGDNVLLAGSGAFADANAGTAKAVNVMGIGLSGNDASNYSLNSTTASTTASIAQKVITVQALGTDKIYDGNTSDSVTLSSSGLLQQDLSKVQFTGASAFTNKNIGVGKAVTVSNISAIGDLSGNYKVSNSSATAYATVTVKAITVSAAGINKVYDGTTTNTVTLSSNDVVSGDTVKFASSSAVFGDKNVGIGKVVTVSGLSLSGTDAKNYSFNANAVTSGSGNANITAKSIAVTATGSKKVYDGSTNVGVDLASSGVVKGDSVSFTDTTATLDNKNVGLGKVVTVTGISALGSDAGNYTLSNLNASATTTAAVTPLTISVMATGLNKPFDGTTNSNVMLQTSGMIAGDSLSFSSTSAKFASSAVGVGKVVTVSGVSAMGADAANYTVLNKTVTTLASTTPK